MGDLRERTVGALAWVSVSVAASAVLRSVSKLVLANILAPSVFGIMALGLLVTETANLFRKLGLNQALIVRDEDIETAADTAFTLLLAGALVLYAVIFLGAPLAASFFREPSLVAVIRVLGLVLLLHSVGQVPGALMEKELEFRELLVPDLTNSVSRIVVAVVLGFQGFGVWSLVWAEVVSVSLSTVLMVRMSSYVPTPGFDRSAAGDLLGFGSQITLSGLASFVYKRMDDFAIGWLLSSTALGYYGIALAFANLPESLFNQIPTKALFPTFSKLDRDGQRRLWYLSIRAVSMLSIPAGVGIAVIAPDLVRITIGRTWLPAVQPLQLLVIYGLLRSLSSGSGNVLKTTGNVRIYSRLMIAHAVGLTLLVFPLVEVWGLEGAALAVVFSSLVNNVGQVYFANRAVGLDNRRLVLPFGKYCILAAGMGLVVQFLRVETDGDSLLYLGLLASTGLVVYAVGILLVDRPFLSEMSDELGPRWRLLSRLTS